MLPPGFGKNLQEVLLSRKRGNKKKMTLFFKPVVLVIDGEGIDSFGFVYLVQALVRLVSLISSFLPAEIDGATAYGVISGRNRGRSYGHNMFSSGVVAWAREALTLVYHLWKGEESQESDFKDAVSLCLLLINAAILDIEKGVFPKKIPTSPSANKVRIPCSMDIKSIWL
ncbi:hypothetical protein GOBAR_AA33191 [Gossypium barbadense]|uniref:Uncharacterized protein n=1 Tax=Gossypium barbadense TaxID=3634 RepID=A0A2P5W8R5_GOSBA|nr:hypothetical protein GOBAR_AA33191 [Gossypium barbadense]